MEEFFKRLKTISKPSDAAPWLEVEYEDYLNFHHFVQFITDFDNLPLLRQEHQPFFFRGQSNAEWTLMPKLFRLLDRVPLEDALRYEFDSVRYFRERAHLFLASCVPTEDDFFGWLALMQHFSAPTRLLDWTSSFVVALYFAVFDEPKCPGAVWLFNAEALWSWMDAVHPPSELMNTSERHQIVSSCDKFLGFGLKRARPRLLGYDPDRKFDRIITQRGVFTICEQLFVDHASIIGKALIDAVTAKKNAPLCKIVISPKGKRFFRKYLNKLNVTASTLFPGTDGLGRTITETIMVHRETFAQQPA